MILVWTNDAKKEKLWLRDWRSSHVPHTSRVAAAAVPRSNHCPSSLIRGKTLWSKGSDCSATVQNNFFWRQELWQKKRRNPNACPSLDSKCSTNTEDGIMNYAWKLNPVMWCTQWRQRNHKSKDLSYCSLESYFKVKCIWILNRI